MSIRLRAPDDRFGYAVLISMGKYYLRFARYQGATLDGRALQWRAIPLILFLLAGYVRFAQLDLAEFKLDEARGLLWATEILENDLFVTRGLPTSVGPVNSPAFLYLLTIPLLFSPEPLWATGFIALINTLAVVGCYGMTRRWFGLGPAIVASLLFALNPWSVIFSRKIWQPAALPIFTVALLACLLLYQRGRRPWWGASALFVWAIAIQMHVSSVALLPVVAFALITGIHRGNLRPLSIGVVLFLVSFVPMAYGETREGWRSLPEALSAGGLDMRSLELTRELLSGAGYPSLSGMAYPQFARLIDQQSGLRSLIERITLILATAAVLYMLASPIWKRRLKLLNAPLSSRDAYWSWRRMVIGLAAASPPLMFLYHPWGALYIHYFVQMWPATFIAVGVLLGDCTAALADRSAIRRRTVLFGGSIVAAIWLLPLSAIQITDHAKFLDFIRQYPTPGGHGLTVGETDSIAETARSSQPSGDVYLVNLSYDLAEALRYSLRQRYHVRGADPAPWRTLVVSSGPTILILESSDQPLTQAIASDMAFSMVAQVPYERGAKKLFLYQYASGNGQARELCQPAKGIKTSASTFDGQVMFAGIRLHPTESGDLIVVNCWHIRQRPVDLPMQLSIFNHLVDSDDNKFTQADGLGHLSAQWRDGDMLLNYYLLPMPADLSDGEYYLLTGFYRLDTGQRIPVEQDDRLTDQLRVGPFVIEKGSVYPLSQ